MLQNEILHDKMWVRLPGGSGIMNTHDGVLTALKVSGCNTTSNLVCYANCSIKQARIAWPRSRVSPTPTPWSLLFPYMNHHRKLHKLQNMCIVPLLKLLVSLQIRFLAKGNFLGILKAITKIRKISEMHFLDSIVSWHGNKWLATCCWYILDITKTDAINLFNNGKNIYSRLKMVFSLCALIYHLQRRTHISMHVFFCVKVLSIVRHTAGTNWTHFMVCFTILCNGLSDRIFPSI